MSLPVHLCQGWGTVSELIEKFDCHTFLSISLVILPLGDFGDPRDGNARQEIVFSNVACLGISLFQNRDPHINDSSY